MSWKNLIKIIKKNNTKDLEKESFINLSDSEKKLLKDIESTKEVKVEVKNKK